MKHYNLISLIKQDFRRSMSLIRILLRNKVGPLSRTKRSSVPTSFIMSVMCFGLMLLTACWYIFAKQTTTVVIGILLFSFFYALNLPFLNFLRISKGNGFVLKSCLFILLDMFSVTLGIIFGFLGYIFGRKY